jgi:hypothetical protein
MNPQQIVRRAIRTGAVAGVLAVTVGTAGEASSAFAATNAHPDGYASSSPGRGIPASARRSGQWFRRPRWSRK